MIKSIDRPIISSKDFKYKILLKLLHQEGIYYMRTDSDMTKAIDVFMLAKCIQ